MVGPAIPWMTVEAESLVAVMAPPWLRGSMRTFILPAFPARSFCPLFTAGRIPVESDGSISYPPTKLEIPGAATSLTR